MMALAAVTALLTVRLSTAWDPWTTNVQDLTGDDADGLGGGACFQAQAVTLQNGSVLVVGGSTDRDHAKQTQLWDPALNRWSAGPQMNYGRVQGMGMTMLTDGRVMVAGGVVYRNDNSGYSSDSLSRTVEILDPDTGTWTDAAQMAVPRQGVALAGLPDGSAAAFGGTNHADQWGSGLKTAERWDPTTQTWAPIAAQMWRGFGSGVQAVTCANGSVLVLGSFGGTVFEPDSQTFSGSVAQMTVNRGSSFGLAALRNGSLIAAGGFDGDKNLRSAEIYMPAPVNVWVRLHQMNYERAGAAATTLDNSSVLVVGASDEASW
jgi:hypothetical protein